MRFHDDITAAQRKKEKSSALRHSQRKHARAEEGKNKKALLEEEEDDDDDDDSPDVCGEPQNSGAANSRVQKTQRAANEVTFSDRQVELFAHLNRW
jgi:hypothetical protein